MNQYKRNTDSPICHISHGVQLVSVTVHVLTSTTEIGSSMEGSVPVVSFGFFYTKAGDETVKDEDTLVAMIMVENKGGYLGVVPLNSKAQFDLLTKELVAFCALLGYNEVETSVKQ